MSLTRSRELPVVHPGVVFKTRVLQKHNISISDAAKKMNINRPHLNNFTLGKVSVTAPLAMKLEKATGITSGFWMNLQKSYDLYVNRNLDVVCEPLVDYKRA